VPVKAPLILADVDSQSHAMHKDSGHIVYWLSLLILIILNMLAASAVSVLQFALSGFKAIIILAILGIFFGFASSRFTSRVANLETKHHILARVAIPAAAILSLVIVTSTANNLAMISGLGFVHSPTLAGLVYGIAFVMPSIASSAANSNLYK